MFKPFWLRLLCLGLLLCSGASFGQSMTLPSGEVLKDPTRPHGGTKQIESKAPSQYTLSYILNSNSRRLAVINGRQLGEGDRVGGARVVRISAQSVVLSENGERRTLSIKPAYSIKKTN